MFKKILFCVAILTFLCNCMVASAEKIVYGIKDKCTLVGEWEQSNQLAYQEGYAIKSQGKENESNATWMIAKSGIYRCYFWKTVDPEYGSKNGKIKVSAEAFQREYQIDFSSGNSGWYEIGMIYIGPAGGTIKISGDNDKIYASAIKLVELDKTYDGLTELNSQYSKYVVMMIDRASCYVDGKQYSTADALPTIRDDRVYVPMRFVSEALGAEVIWDSTQDCAVVSINNKVMSFKANTDECTINNELKTMQGRPYIENERLMLPLRFIAENMGKNVYWTKNGVIFIMNDTFDVGSKSMLVNKIAKVLNREG